MSGLGRACAVDGSGRLAVYRTDRLGSVRAITDRSGAVAQTYKTDEPAIPDAAGTQGSLSQPFQCTGEEWDVGRGARTCG